MMMMMMVCFFFFLEKWKLFKTDLSVTSQDLKSPLKTSDSKLKSLKPPSKAGKMLTANDSAKPNFKLRFLNLLSDDVTAFSAA